MLSIYAQSFMYATGMHGFQHGAASIQHGRATVWGKRFAAVLRMRMTAAMAELASVFLAYRDRRILAALDDRTLHDIGVSRGNIPHVVAEAHRRSTEG